MTSRVRSPTWQVLTVVGAAGILAVPGCASRDDSAAKQRIFSPADPLPATAAASQPLNAAEAWKDTKVQARILTMTGAEVSERLGACRYDATVTWRWTSTGPPVAVVERRKVVFGPGGVSGDFWATQDISESWGFEVWRIHGRTFGANTFGAQGGPPLRERRRDHGMAIQMRQLAFGALGELFELFDSRLVISKPLDTRTLKGRSVIRYRLALGEPRNVEKLALPPLLVPKGGPDETTRRRSRFWEHKRPVDLEGEILVDAKTAVVLQAKASGHLAVNTPGEPIASLEISYEGTTSVYDAAPTFDLPEFYEPDEDRPDGIAAALSRFGFGRGSGTKAGDDDSADENDEGAH